MQLNRRLVLYTVTLVITVLGVAGAVAERRLPPPDPQVSESALRYTDARRALWRDLTLVGTAAVLLAVFASRGLAREVTRPIRELRDVAPSAAARE